jgi:hypothetical protein
LTYVVGGGGSGGGGGCGALNKIQLIKQPNKKKIFSWCLGF